MKGRRCLFLVLFAKCVPAPRPFSERDLEEAGVAPRARCGGGGGGDEQPLTLGSASRLSPRSLKRVASMPVLRGFPGVMESRAIIGNIYACALSMGSLMCVELIVSQREIVAKTKLSSLLQRISVHFSRTPSGRRWLVAASGQAFIPRRRLCCLVINSDFVIRSRLHSASNPSIALCGTCFDPLRRRLFIKLGEASSERGKCYASRRISCIKEYSLCCRNVIGARN